MKLVSVNKATPVLIRKKGNKVHLVMNLYLPRDFVETCNKKNNNYLNVQLVGDMIEVTKDGVRTITKNHNCYYFRLPSEIIQYYQYNYDIDNLKFGCFMNDAKDKLFYKVTDDIKLFM